MLYPLSYGGYATWERVPVNEPSSDTRRGKCAITGQKTLPSRA